MNNKSIFVLILGISAFINLENLTASEVSRPLFSSITTVSSAQYNEQKFLIPIRAQQTSRIKRILARIGLIEETKLYSPLYFA